MIAKIKKTIWRVKYKVYSKLCSYYLSKVKKHSSHKEYDKNEHYMTLFNKCLNKQYDMFSKLIGGAR